MKKLESKTSGKVKTKNKDKQALKQPKNLPPRKISQILFKRFSTIIEGGQQPKKAEDGPSKDEPRNENESLPPRILFPQDPKAPKTLVSFNPLNNETVRQELVS